MRSKIKSIEDISEIVFELKSKGKKIIHCHGVFDLLHIGHIKHFEEAKMLGDILIVTVTADNFVNKGPNRPAFSEENRIKALAALSAVDYVVLSKNPTAIQMINELKPNIYCKGPDYKFHKNDTSGQIKKEIAAVKKNGGKTIFTKGITFSSSKLINKFGETYSSEQKSLINKIKNYLSSVNNINLELIDKFNLNGDYTESQAFAFLAIRSFLNLPISFSTTTGCKGFTVGGKLVENF